MSSTRVLALDHPGHYEDRSGEFTLLELDDILPQGSGYRPSARTRRLAREATREVYDYVIIGHNWGTGLTLAELIQEELKPRTLVVWSDELPEEKRQDYEHLGIFSFAHRSEMFTWLSEQRGKAAAAALLSTVSCPSPNAPLCLQCGIFMTRAGSGYACASCGATSGFRSVI